MPHASLASCGWQKSGCPGLPESVACSSASFIRRAHCTEHALRTLTMRESPIRTSLKVICMALRPPNAESYDIHTTITHWPWRQFSPGWLQSCSAQEQGQPPCSKRRISSYEACYLSYSSLEFEHAPPPSRSCQIQPDPLSAVDSRRALGFHASAVDITAAFLGAQPRFLMRGRRQAKPRCRRSMELTPKQDLRPSLGRTTSHRLPLNSRPQGKKAARPPAADHNGEPSHGPVLA